jgi:macrolide-specific efflux system membrane fusion protein
MTPESDTTATVRQPPAPTLQQRAAALWSRVGRYVLAVGACLLLFAGGYYAWQTWFAEDDASASIVTAVATRGNLEDTVTATGTLQPKDFVDVGTQVSGQVKALHVEIGATVKKGQLLAEIDPSVYQSKVDADRAQLLNQQAQLADRQAQLALAELQLTRQQNMNKENATTAEALQSADAARKSALAQVNAIRAQMQQTESTLRGDQANLNYTKIYAPIAGTVVSQAAKLGQTLNANQQAPIVMRIADLATMTVQAQVSEADVPKLRVGMDVYFTTLGGDNRRYYGKLRQIPPTPTVVNNVVLYDALFDVENPNQKLMTQMTAQVFFVVASATDAVLVPITALHSAGAGRARGAGKRAERRTDEAKAGERKSGERKSGERAQGSDPRARFARGGAAVSVVDAEGKIEERGVKVGAMNRISAEIVSGLEPGEKVVIGSRTAAAKAPPAKAAESALVPSAGKGRGRP